MLRGLKILLVEDDPAQTKLFSLLLKTNFPNVKLIAFESGTKILEFLSGQLENKDYTTIVLSDLNLPDMTGLQLLSILNKEVLYSNLRFIIFSQSINESVIQQAFAEGAQAILCKPDSIEKFESLLSSLVNFWSLTQT